MSAHTRTASGPTVLIRFTMKTPHSNSRGARHSYGDLRESGVQHPSRIAKNLVGAAATHAEEALTVRVVLVATEGLELAAFHLAQHSAKRWMTIRGTHGPDDFWFASGHGHLRLRHPRRAILSETA